MYFLLKVDCVVITDLLDERVLVGGAFAEKLFGQPVNKLVVVYVGLSTSDINSYHLLP
jgi:hypothetical protein